MTNDLGKRCSLDSKVHVFCHTNIIKPKYNLFPSLCFDMKGVMKRRDQTQAELDSKVEALMYKKADTDLVSF